jgi:tellurite resistance protein TerC
MDALFGNPLFLPFLLFGGVALLIDLRATGRRGSSALPVRTALAFTAMWITCAIGFSVLIRITPGVHPGESIGTQEGLITYLTGYLVEYALSIDNIFAFTLVFAALATPKEARQRALAWGIVLSLVLRLGMILIGASLVERFESVLYLFGIFLIITAWRMAADEGGDKGDSGIAKAIARRLNLPPTQIAILVISIVNLIFAVDSIPAIFGITRDPFIVLTSTTFAMFGLRSLYFLLADAKERFHLLSYGIALVLAVIGVKMLMPIVGVHIDPIASLGLVVLIIVGSIVASILRPARHR